MSKHTWTFLTLCMAFALSGGASASEPPVAFTRKPAATRQGEKSTVMFSVNRETDVAVFVEDAKGKIVRHLVSGVLGANPPAPLKAGALDQTIEWDGKADYGKPA